jgi:hypothetical protein
MAWHVPVDHFSLSMTSYTILSSVKMLWCHISVDLSYRVSLPSIIGYVNCNHCHLEFQFTCLFVSVCYFYCCDDVYGFLLHAALWKHEILLASFLNE